MRIESVTAHAFGPLAEETLELAPGLTVVAGINESAKSSWHAALYAALCGRGREAPTPQDRRLVDRYKPWDGAAWLLSSVVVLDDGRRLRLCQDLDRGELSRVEAIAETQRLTRRYARRQVSWFGRYPGLVWQEPEEVDVTAVSTFLLRP